ncbi:MAG TPA: xyloglucanase, partial [Opitutaceae bacterium]
MRPPSLALFAVLLLSPAAVAQSPAPAHDPYTFKNVALGGGGFVTGIIFSPTQKGLVYARTDVGGAYRRDAKSGRWIPLLDWADQTDWNLYGVESLATDPVDPRRVYIAAGTYTSENVANGELLRSADYGATWARTPLPFKFGANEAGRGNGERLMVDPNDNSVLLLGTRNAGLWRSTDFGATWIHMT